MHPITHQSLNIKNQNNTRPPHQPPNQISRHTTQARAQQRARNTHQATRQLNNNNQSKINRKQSTPSNSSQKATTRTTLINQLSSPTSHNQASTNTRTLQPPTANIRTRPINNIPIRTNQSQSINPSLSTLNSKQQNLQPRHKATSTARNTPIPHLPQPQRSHPINQTNTTTKT